MGRVFEDTKPVGQALDAVNEFAELVDLGCTLIADHDIYNRKKTLKEQFVHRFMFPMHNFAESLVLLLSQSRTHSSWVIMRSMFEARFNMHWVLNCSDDRNAEAYRVASDQEHVVQLKRIIKFIEENPEVADDDEFNAEKLQDIIDELQPKIDEVRNAFNPPLPQELPSLFKRCLDIDAMNKAKSDFIPRSSAEHYYRVYYSHFSHPAHLTPQGLLMFFKEENPGEYEVYLSGNPEDVLSIAQLGQSLYWEFLDWYLQDFAPEKRPLIEKWNPENLAKQ